MKRLLFSLSILAAGITAHSQVQLVKDINFGNTSSTPSKLTVFNGKLVFFAIDPAYGRELHMMDSAENISLVYNINPGQSSSFTSGNYYTPMAVLDNMLYFYADDGTHGTELFRWDGSNPPVMTGEVNTSGSSIISDVIVYNNKIFFNAYTSATGTELWQYDPATDEITLVADIYPNSTSSGPTSLIVYNNKLYFTALNASTGRELHVYDDATGTIEMVMDIYPGNISSSPQNLTTGNGRLYFSATDPVAGRELYALADTAVSRLTDLYAGINSSVYPAPSGTSSITAWKGEVYFGGTNNTVSGYQLFKYDHKSNKASLVYNINPSSSSSPFLFTRFENKLFFTANTPSVGSELWAYDGMGNVKIVSDVNSGTQSSIPRNFTVFNNKLYFNAITFDFGDELFVYRDSTLSVQDINSGADVSIYPNPATVTANISVTLKNAEQLSISIADITGKEVFNTGVQSYRSGDNTISIPVHQVADGIYIYTVTNNNGNVYYRGKLIKQ